MDVQASAKLDLAKGYITESHLGDDFKSLMLNALNMSYKATNGVSQDEKIQLMTLSICDLIQAMGIFSSRIDSRIKEVNDEQCEKCPAKQYVNEHKNFEQHEELINKKLHKVEDEEVALEKGWLRILEKVLTRSGFWFFLTIMGTFAFSPFLKDILETIASIFGGK